MSKARPPLVKLERTIASRAAKPNEKSYTSQLLAGGVAKMGAKIVEEAAEVVEAADEPGDTGREHFVREAADLFYHLLVLMRHRECGLADVEAELARRFGVSGLKEKASRTASVAISGTGAEKKRARKVGRKKSPSTLKTRSRPRGKSKTKSTRATAKSK
jgi:phosphoribosyl-ATP pyrophosphohydrolase